MRTTIETVSDKDLVPGVDTVMFLDDLWYTTEGAIKVMGIGKTTLSLEIKHSNIEVFKHPNGHLFSKPSILNWMAKRTKKAKR